MKKEFAGYGILLVVMMAGSFFAGYNFSPDKNTMLNKDIQINELKNTIIQQQINNAYIMKHMMSYPKINTIKTK